MSYSRGQFLKKLGKSLPGMLLGGGAAAAKQILDKVAAVAGNEPIPVMTGKVPTGAIVAGGGRPTFIDRGPPEGNRVALTFDDGPTPGVTDLILDELHRRNLRATFFMIGRNIAAAPDLARRAFAEGHTIANHTFTHPRLTELSDAQVTDELKRTQDIIAELLNIQPTWFRPPFGSFHARQAHLAQGLGLRVVLWNVDPNDWSDPDAERVAKAISTKARTGSIIVCHDYHRGTAQALPAIFDRFAESGLAQVNLDKLFT